MEQEQDRSLFDMNMDSTTQSHLLSISRWTKFISVTGFIVGGLILLLLASNGTEIVKQFSRLFSFGNGDIAGALIAFVLVVMILVICWVYFLFRSSILLKRGLQNRNTVQLADGFKAMRIYFIFSFIMSTLTILSTLRSLL